MVLANIGMAGITLVHLLKSEKNMWAGDNVLALVWSFSNEMQDIPYRIELVAKRYSCTCPAFTHRKYCKHLGAWREGAKDGSILKDDRFNVTDYGKQVIGK